MYPHELADILLHSPPASFFGFPVDPHSTSDEAEDHHRHHHHLLALNDERRRRRMISNRESARRSRIRKQRHLDELRLHVARLLATNRLLLNELNQMMRRQEEVLGENARLRGEEEWLQRKLKELKAEHGDSTVPGLGDAEHGPCNVAHLRREAMLTSSCVPLVFP